MPAEPVTFAGPRALKAPGSVEWCYQTLELLKIRWEREQFVASEFQAILNEAIAQRIWERIPPEQPYGDYEVMMQAALGTTAAGVQRRLLAHGGDRKSAQAREDQGSNATLIGRGARYRAARLERDWPELHARVLAGEMSAHAAAIEAGFCHRSIRVPLDLAAAARSLRRHLSADQRQQLIALLQEEEV